MASGWPAKGEEVMMPTPNDEKIVCRCLQVSESEIVQALATGMARNLCEIKRLTGAGEACTCCVRMLKRYVAAGEEQMVAVGVS